MKGTNIENRLTEQDESGNWSLKGVKWSDLYVGSVVTRETSDRLYGALAKLHDYEETELMPDEIENLKDVSAGKLLDNESHKPDRRSFVAAVGCFYVAVRDIISGICDTDSQNLEKSFKEIVEYVDSLYPKQAAKKPIFYGTKLQRGRKYGELVTIEKAYNCPSCNLTLWELDKFEYCPHCGQTLDWSGASNKTESEDEA